MAIPLAKLEAESISISPTFSLKEEYDKFTKNPSKKVAITAFKNNDKSFKILLEGELFTDGILYSTDYKTHSIGFKFSDTTYASLFEHLFLDVLNKKPSDDPDWTYVSLIKSEEQIWLKLKTDDAKTAYKVKSNRKLHPKKPMDADIHIGDHVQVIADVSAYFSHENKTFGICLNVRELNFE